MLLVTSTVKKKKIKKQNHMKTCYVCRKKKKKIHQASFWSVKPERPDMSEIYSNITAAVLLEKLSAPAHIRAEDGGAMVS